MVVIPSDSAGADWQRIPPPASCRILVIDRQPLFLALFRELLHGAPFEAAIRTAVRSDVAIQLLENETFDIVFCDLGAQPLPWTAVVEANQAKASGCPVVLLGESGDEKQLPAAVHSGVSGFFTFGGRVIHSVLWNLDADRRQRVPQAARSLSRTELEILRMLAQAQPIAEIARSRSVSPKTVRNHVASIYRKLDLRTRTEAMLWAVRTGLAG
jgi:DNA-binding NarL/FixJ family response regulator